MNFMCVYFVIPDCKAEVVYPVTVFSCLFRYLNTVGQEHLPS